MIFMLLIAVSCGHYMKKKKSKYIQEAAVTTLLGILAAGGLIITGNSGRLQTMQAGFMDIFMVVLLPPIIFER